jgi:hypothetical protein
MLVVKHYENVNNEINTITIENTHFNDSARDISINFMISNLTKKLCIELIGVYKVKK